MGFFFKKKKFDLMFRIPFHELDNAAYIRVACTCLTHTKTWLTFMFVLICTFRAGWYMAIVSYGDN